MNSSNNKIRWCWKSVVVAAAKLVLWLPLCTCWTTTTTTTLTTNEFLPIPPRRLCRYRRRRQLQLCFRGSIAYSPRRDLLLSAFSSSSRGGKSGEGGEFGIYSDGMDQHQHQRCDSALCIVPPDEAWDTLQRARHVARDLSYQIWPPAIRLFHPLPDNFDALQVARIIEKHNIQPFTVHLNQWAVIPHLEAMAAQLDWMNTIAEQQQNSDGEELYPIDPQQAQIDALIEREERLGRQNKARREQRRREKEGNHIDKRIISIQGDNNNNNLDHEEEPYSLSDESSASSSPRQMLQQQRRMMYEEFNGPCVICLEPDEESRQKLDHLREILRKELLLVDETFVDQYSPTATVVSPNSIAKARTATSMLLHGKSSSSSSSSSSSAEPFAAAADYRPLVPIGAFATVSEAIRMARKLRSLWKPLTFEVTDLQLVSASTPMMNAALRTTDTRNSNNINTKEQVGCDAMIMLMGQEVPVDMEEAQQMARMIYERGERGGVERTSLSEDSSTMRSSKQQKSLAEVDGDDNDDDECSLLWQQFLDEDDVDEGTVVVIGRTHFFTGEMRLYVGMPATSTSEQATSTSHNSNNSGPPRKRGSTHKQNDDFGQALDDSSEAIFLPSGE